MERGVNSNKIKVVILIMLFIAVAVYFLMDYFSVVKPVYYGGASAVNLTASAIIDEFDAETRPYIYASDKGGYFYAMKDGIKYFGPNGKEVVSTSFNMNDPIIVGEENVVGVWEFRGTEVYVFSDKGELHSHKSTEPILNMSVNAKGYCSFTTQEKEGYKLFVYDEKGVKLNEGIFTVNNIYPMASSLSDDGKFLAVSLLDVNGASMNSQVTYSHLKSGDSIQYTEVFASSVMNVDEIVSSLRFVGSNLIIVSDKKIKCVDMSNPSKDKWSFDLYNKLDNICFNGLNGFAIALGDAIINKPSEKSGLVKYFDINSGELLWEYQPSSKNKVSLLSSGFDSIIVGVGRNFTALDAKGAVLWSFGSMENVSEMFFYEGADNIIQVSDKKAVIYKVNGSIEEQPEEAEDLKPEDAADLKTEDL